MQIFMNGEAYDTMDISGEAGKVQKVLGEIQASAGEYELVLKFAESDSLEIVLK